jgi:hypothetical protein
VEIWFHDEARVGQKNGLVYPWAKQGSRPRQPHDQRTAWACLFGAVCPTKAPLWFCRAPIPKPCKCICRKSRTVAPGIVVMDKAGWHTTPALQVPPNLSLLHLPPRAQPPGERMAVPAPLSNRVFDGYQAIVEACCKAWNALLAQVGRIASIATRT